MMYIVIAIKELNDPVVELAGIFDTQEKAFEACKMVEEWLEDDGFDNYDVFVLEAVKNFLVWYDLEKYFE
jgi:hypothetical protein